MNWKLVVVGGLAYYLVTFIISFGTGPLIHEGILDETYRQTESFWRPELREDPPDLAALMPRWIISGLISSFITAAIFGCVRTAFSGPGWRRGISFGIVIGVLMSLYCLGWSGVFDLPNKLWVWWAVEGFLYLIPGGAVLGWVGDKLAPLP